MSIFLKILGVIWILGGVLAVAAAVFGTMADGEAPADSILFLVGASIGAALVMTPIWLTGIAFFLLPGWVRKQLAGKQTDIFA